MFKKQTVHIQEPDVLSYSVLEAKVAKKGNFQEIGRTDVLMWPVGIGRSYHNHISKHIGSEVC